MGKTVTAMSIAVSTHSRPRAADFVISVTVTDSRFQHTAARGRLKSAALETFSSTPVSTHSRPRAADKTIHKN